MLLIAGAIGATASLALVSDETVPRRPAFRRDALVQRLVAAVGRVRSGNSPWLGAWTAKANGNEVGGRSNPSRMA